VDLVGPLLASEDGYLYVMTMVDRTTRWLEAVPLKNISLSLSNFFIALISYT
jgi:hypothetical protein